MSEGDLFTDNILRSQVDIPMDHRIVWLNSTDNVVQDQPVAEGDIVDIIVTDDQDDGPETIRYLKTYPLCKGRDGRGAGSY